MSEERDRLIHNLESQIASMGAYLEDLKHLWSSPLDASDSRWKIVLALAQSSGGQGSSVAELSTTLCLDMQSIVGDSEILEESGLVSRMFSTADQRTMTLSLTEKSIAELAILSARQRSLEDFVGSEEATGEMEQLIVELENLKARAEKARLGLASYPL